MVNLNGENDSLFDSSGVDHHRYGSIKSSLENGNIVHASILVGGSFDDDNPAPIPTRNNYYAPPQSLVTNDDDNEGNNLLLLGEMTGMANLAAPVVLTYFLEMLPGIVTLILVGRTTEMAYYDKDGIGTTTNSTEDDDNARKLRLDAASLAVMFTNVVALSPAYGILTAMDTLCSQAYGAGQSSKIGTFSLTGLVVISFFLVSSSLILWNTSSILVALGQPTEVSIMAGTFAIYMLPGLPFLYIYNVIKRICQSKNDAHPMLMAAVACNVANLICGWYFVRRYGWMGAALARSVGNAVEVPTILGCMVWKGWRSAAATRSSSLAMPSSSSLSRRKLLPATNSKMTSYESGCSSSSYSGDVPDDEWGTQQYLEIGGCRKFSFTKGSMVMDAECRKETDAEFLRHVYDGFVSWEEALSLKAIGDFMRLGIPGMLQVMFEWCAFEVLALLCGILPGQEAIIAIGANSIIMNVTSLTYTLYLGASVSGNVRVGNALGAGDARRAEIASNLALASGAAISFLNMGFLLIFRKTLPMLFTTDVGIIEKAQHLLLIATAFQLPDAINACNQGIFRGSGRQSLSALFNFVAFYVIGLPLGYVLGIHLGYGIEGLWIGITTSLFTIALGSAIVVLQSDWNKLAFDANMRII